jgi:hypothetical protein
MRFFDQAAIAIVAALPVVALAGQQDSMDERRFSERSIRGCYVSSLLGTVVPDPTTPAFQLPIAALVRFCADGRGQASVIATQNIGGSCIIEQEGDAAYTVEASGVGVATATLENKEVSFGCGNLNPPATVGGAADFELRFGIQKDRCLQVIGTALVPQGGLPVGLVMQGPACP